MQRSQVSKSLTHLKCGVGRPAGPAGLVAFLRRCGHFRQLAVFGIDQQGSAAARGIGFHPVAKADGAGLVFGCIAFIGTGGLLQALLVFGIVQVETVTELGRALHRDAGDIVDGEGAAKVRNAPAGAWRIEIGGDRRNRGKVVRHHILRSGGDRQRQRAGGKYGDCFQGRMGHYSVSSVSLCCAPRLAGSIAGGGPASGSICSTIAPRAYSCCRFVRSAVM